MSTRTDCTPSTGCSVSVIVRSQCSHEISGTFSVTLLIYFEVLLLRNGDGAAHTGGVVARNMAAILQRSGFVEGVDEADSLAGRYVDLAGLGVHGRTRGHLALVVELFLGRANEKLVRDCPSVANLERD